MRPTQYGSGRLLPAFHWLSCSSRQVRARTRPIRSAIEQPSQPARVTTFRSPCPPPWPHRRLCLRAPLLRPLSRQRVPARQRRLRPPSKWRARPQRVFRSCSTSSACASIGAPRGLRSRRCGSSIRPTRPRRASMCTRRGASGRHSRRVERTVPANARCTSPRCRRISTRPPSRSWPHSAGPRPSVVRASIEARLDRIVRQPSQRTALPAENRAPQLLAIGGERIAGMGVDDDPASVGHQFGVELTRAPARIARKDA